MKKIFFFLLMCTTCYGQVPQFLEQPIFLNNSIIPRATLLIDLIPGHSEITKPLIVVEGFDPGAVTEPEEKFGETDLIDFIESIQDGNSLDLDDLTINNTANRYDIIYVNWANGMDDIKENSKVLKAIIDWVNTNKQGNQPNVLLGQSMGGLVGRYTLAKMEQDEENHDVRLFIAHDSPMQGANTPVSTQYFSRHVYDEYTSAPLLYGFMENVIPSILNFVDLMLSTNLAVKFPSLDDILTIQDTPAAMQMNYHYVDLASDATTAVHSVWQTEFDAMGYPEEPINIAISNGNECAVDHGFAPRAKFISLHDTDNPDFFGDLVHMLATPIIGDQINDFSLAILGTLPGSSKYFYDFDLHANPLTFASGRQVYAGKVRYEKKFLWLVKMTHTMMERNKTVPLGYLPFDTYSGGYYDIGNVIEELPFSSNVVVNRRYGFIPVVSALDIRRNNQPVLEADYLKRYAVGTTPEPALTSGFDAFLVDFNEGINNKHISFQVRNGNWLASYLQDQTPTITDCSFICSKAVPINGTAFFCTTATYSINPPAGITEVNWSIESDIPNHLTLTTNGNQATITVTSETRGRYINLNCTIGNDECGSTVISKQIWVGRPDIFTYDANSNETFFGQSYHYPISSSTRTLTVYSHFPNTTMAWEMYPTNIVWQAYGNTATFYINQQGNYVLTAKATNECGTYLLFYTISVGNGTGLGDGLRYTVAPNPVQTNNLSIGETPIENSEIQSFSMQASTTEESVTIQLYDFTGTLVKTQNNVTKTYNNAYAMDITDLANGHYFVTIIAEGFNETHQIIIDK